MVLTSLSRPGKGHTELEEELHEHAHIDYDRVAIIANPSVAALYEDALVYETGTAITSSGALTAYSGAKTGRSPSDKRIVKEESSEKEVWWGPVNKPMTPDVSQAFCSIPCLALLHPSCTSCLRFSLRVVVTLVDKCFMLYWVEAF
jgi:hypothetical protein